MATTSPARAIGVDIGGTGIKGAPVDLDAGAFAAERIRIPTPQPATPDAVAAVVNQIVTQLDAPGTIGLTLPSVVLDGIVQTAANIDDSWIGTDAKALFEDATGRPVGVVNDADAAGIAEVRFGAGRDGHGVVLLITLGTGIGSALFVDGTLVPNTELGHLPLHHGDAEEWAAESVREDDDLSWKEWGERLSDYVELVEKLLWPNLIIIGGGVSKKSEKFLPHIHARTEIVPAQLLNDAGIVGAALFAPTA
jgi:polyphosphate glucokinase